MQGSGGGIKIFWGQMEKFTQWILNITGLLISLVVIMLYFAGELYTAWEIHVGNFRVVYLTIGVCNLFPNGSVTMKMHEKG